MKKIMFYCHDFFPNSTGYSNAFQNLINAVIDFDRDSFVSVVTPVQLPTDIFEITKERLEVIRLKPKYNIRKLGYVLNEIFYANFVSKKFKTESYDLLFVETFDSAIFLNFLNKNIFPKLVVRVHSTNETEYTFFNNDLQSLLRRYLIVNFLAKKIKWFLSTNSYHIDFVKKYYFKGNLISIAKTNFFVLPNSINVIPNIPMNRSNDLKLFLLGRMDSLGNNQKGFSDFIYALKLMPSNILLRFRIKIVGKGNMKSELMSLCADLPNIEFIDSLPHDKVIQELLNSDVVALPSRYEGLSMFALEGLATSNVCIFARTGGLIDLIDGNGFYFEPQNIESIVSALKNVANSDLDEIQKMKIRSIQIAQASFSPEVVSTKFRMIFDIINKSNQSQAS